MTPSLRVRADSLPSRLAAVSTPEMKPRSDNGVSRRRKERQLEIIAATRSLFDKRGRTDVQIEDIAKAVGINRAIIYRHFTGKEELFAMTLVGYMNELLIALGEADDPELSPEDRLRAISARFLEFGREFPAFVDCAQSLLRRPGDELMHDVSQPVMFSLGVSISSCLAVVVAVLEAGVESGDFTMKDPYLLANVLYSQALGGLNLARLQLSIREVTPGLPEISALSFDQVRSYIIEAAVAMARGIGAKA